MDRWQYKVTLLPKSPERTLNELGAEGWELVALVERDDDMQPWMGYLKRRVLPSEPR